MNDLMCRDDPSETTGNVCLRPRSTRFGSAVSKPRLPLPGLSQIDLLKLFVPSPAGTGDQDKMCKAPHLVLQYIVDEMRVNAESDEIQSIKTLNETNFTDQALKEAKDAGWLWWVFMGESYIQDMQRADIANRLAANAKFMCLVMDARAGNLVTCGRWDHKPLIRNNGWGVSQTIDFRPIDHDIEIDFYYDIWSNIHYGFVGLAAGFTEEHLHSSASTENAVSNLGGEDPLSDRVSIQIGLDLYREHGTRFGLMKLLDELYQHRGSLHRYDPSRPQAERVYTIK